VSRTKNAKQLSALIQRVNTDQPSQKDIAAFRQLLKAKPDMLDHMYALTKLTERLLSKSVGNNELLRARVEHDIERTAQELGHAQSSPLEKMIIDLVALNKTRLLTIELLATAVMVQPNQHTSSVLYWERRLTMTQARYLRSLETLARVRRLLRPTANVQVNIADQQLNVVQAPQRHTRRQKAAPKVVVRPPPND
jgi:hypothetical protein